MCMLFGVSGVSFAQCLGTLPYIESEFDPDVYLILLSSFGISRSLDPSISPYRFYLEESDSGFVLTEPLEVFTQNRYGRILFRSALARYLRLNKQVFSQKLHVDADEMISSERTPEQIPSEYLRAGRFFLEEFHKLLPDDKIIFFSNGACLDYKIIDELLESDSVFTLVDIAGYLSEDFADNGIEFHRVYDPHWNNYGHEVVAKAVFPYVRQALNELEY